jgi:hypothetical protein
MISGRQWESTAASGQAVSLAADSPVIWMFRELAQFQRSSFVLHLRGDKPRGSPIQHSAIIILHHPPHLPQDPFRGHQHQEQQQHQPPVPQGLGGQ